MPPAPASPSKLPRLTSWWVIAALLSVAVFFIAPQQVPVSLYKLNLIALAAVAGYWIDRKVFPYARPIADVVRQLEFYAAWHYGNVKVDKENDHFVMVEGVGRVDVHSVPQTPPPASVTYFALGCMLRRAIIIAAAMLAISLGA